MAHELFLVPGFLGYVRFGRFHYFDDSALAALCVALDAKGLRDMRVTVLPTDPTGSLYDRQQQLLRLLGERAGGASGIHLVGHSTGGVDSWLLLRKRPLGAMTWNDPYGVRARIRSVTAVSAPFWGSYLAERVADFGPSLAREIPLEQPHVEHEHVARGARPGQPVARSRHELLDLLLGALRSPMTLGLLARVALNHRLLEDLRPQRMFEVQTSYEPDPVNADVSFAYFVTVASPPAAPNSLFDYFDAPQFRAAHGLAGDVRDASVPPGIARSDLDAAPWIEGQMVDGERPAVTLAANDGVVNSLLQTLPRRPPRALVRADHADVLGHFRRAAPPRSGELNSPSGFDERALDTLYRGIVENIHAGTTSRGRPADPAGARLG